MAAPLVSAAIEPRRPLVLYVSRTADIDTISTSHRWIRRCPQIWKHPDSAQTTEARLGSPASRGEDSGVLPICFTQDDGYGLAGIGTCNVLLSFPKT